MYNTRQRSEPLSEIAGKIVSRLCASRLQRGVARVLLARPALFSEVRFRGPRPSAYTKHQASSVCDERRAARLAGKRRGRIISFTDKDQRSLTCVSNRFHFA
jgi:hypothetical protein